MTRKNTRCFMDCNETSGITIKCSDPNCNLHVHLYCAGISTRFTKEMPPGMLFFCPDCRPNAYLTLGCRLADMTNAIDELKGRMDEIAELKHGFKCLKDSLDNQAHHVDELHNSMAYLDHPTAVLDLKLKVILEEHLSQSKAQLARMAENFASDIEKSVAKQVQSVVPCVELPMRQFCNASTQASINVAALDGVFINRIDSCGLNMNVEEPVKMMLESSWLPNKVRGLKKVKYCPKAPAITPQKGKQWTIHAKSLRNRLYKVANGGTTAIPGVGVSDVKKKFAKWRDDQHKLAPPKQIKSKGKQKVAKETVQNKVQGKGKNQVKRTHRAYAKVASNSNGKVNYISSGVQSFPDVTTHNPLYHVQGNAMTIPNVAKWYGSQCHFTPLPNSGSGLQYGNAFHYPGLPYMDMTNKYNYGLSPRNDLINRVDHNFRYQTREAQDFLP